MLKFQFDRACFQRGEAYSYVHLLLLVCSVSIAFILHIMICHRRLALTGVYPPWQPVSVSFFANVNSSSRSLYVIGRPSVVCLIT